MSPQPLEALLEGAIADHSFPGAAFGVSFRGRTAMLGAAGRFTFDEQSPRVLPDTPFDLASVTKVAATTAMAMLLYQRGLLDLDAPLRDWQPKLAGAITARLLLAHASGLPAYHKFYKEAAGRERVLEAALLLAPEYTPGAEARYSDPGFLLLGAALEALAGEPLDQFCGRDIFAPLGMAHTRFGRPAEGDAPPTEIDDDFRRRTVENEPHDENCWAMGGVAGHAGLFAPAADLLRFAEAMLAPLHGRPSMFARETVELFTRRAGLPPGSSRALGWDTPSGSPSSAGALAGPRCFGHLGYTGTSLWIDPVLDAAFVLLTNRTFPKRGNNKIAAVRPAFHDAARKLLQNDTLRGAPPFS